MQQFSIEISQLDPVPQYFSPFLLVNPWSLSTPFSFQFMSTVLTSGLNYTCNISYGNGQFVELGAMKWLWNDSFVQGQCNFGPTKEHFDIELGVAEEATVSIIPILNPPFRISVSTLSYWIYSQPILSQVSPASAYAKTNITVSGEGFLPMVFVQDKFNHKWEVYDAQETSFTFLLLDLRIPSGSMVCFQVSCNNNDFTSSNCTESNSLIYLGPRPPPSSHNPQNLQVLET